MARPAAPANARWERISDRGCTIKWDKVVGATSYGIRWLRGTQTDFGNSKQGWAGITGLSFTVPDWAVNTGQRFVVYATNKDGNSLYSNVTGWFYTPPPVPVNVKATVTAGGVLTSWSRAGSYYVSGTEVQLEGQGPVVLGNGTGGAAPTTYLFADVGGAGLRFRVRGFVGGTGVGQRVYGRWSDWTTPVTRMVAPGPPLLAVLPYVAAGSPVVFRWTPAPVDGSVQTGAEVRYRPVGGSSWTTRTVTGAATTYSQSGLLGQYEWQARSKALSGEFGDWSPVGVVRVISLPVVALDPVPVDASQIVVSWVYTQPQSLPQSGAVVELLQGGGVVERVQTNGPINEVVLQTVLADATTYTVRVKASCSGLWSEVASVAFTTLFVKPEPPVLDVVWDDLDGVHRLSVGPGKDTIPPVTVALTVQRDTGSGWEDIAIGLLPEDTTLVDDLGLTGDVATGYRALAYTAQGAAIATDASVVAGSGAVWLRSDLGRLPVRYNADWAFTPSKPNRDLIWFDGDSKPTVFDDDAVGRVLTWSGTLLPERVDDVENLPQIRAMLNHLITSEGLLRVSTPDGLLFEGVLTSGSVSTQTSGVGKISLRIEEAK